MFLLLIVLQQNYSFKAVSIKRHQWIFMWNLKINLFIFMSFLVIWHTSFHIYLHRCDQVKNSKIIIGQLIFISMLKNVKPNLHTHVRGAVVVALQGYTLMA